MHNLYLEIRRNESLTFDPLIFGAQEQILRIYESFVVLFTLEEVLQSDLCMYVCMYVSIYIAHYRMELIPDLMTLFRFQFGRCD
jgi:hypothetical protein